ncbi:MAG: methyltransferase domain-containing protein, partial [Flammeovirgaceae bacterium]
PTLSTIAPIAYVASVIKGGVLNLTAKQMDARDMATFPSEMFDVTTALRVLEYIEDVSLAIAEICRVTKRFIIILYAAHPDNDPDKKHVFTAEKLKKYFHDNDVMQVRFEMMSNYHMVIARK